MSEVFVWDSKYSVGDDQIDNQHQNLFRIVNTLSEKQDSIEINRIILEVFKYTRIHFEHEEEMFKLLDFEYQDEHQALHNTLIFQLGEFSKSSIDRGEGVEKFKRFMVDWLKNHILVEDMKYARKLK